MGTRLRRPGRRGPGAAGGLAVTLALAVGVAGCTAARSESDGGGGPAVTTTTTSRPADAPRPGGTLRVALAAPPVLDPALADEPAEALVAALLFDTLVDADRETGTPRAGLAATWTADAAQQRFVFTLRDAARFADGSRVTAADVRASLERVRDPATGSPAAGLLEPVTGIEAPDPSTVVITTSRPLSTLPSVLAHPALGIAPAGALAGGPAFAAAPLGSGPFRVAGSEGATVILERAPGGAAYVERVALAPVEDGGAGVLAAVAEGRADVGLLAREQAAEAPTRGVRTVQAPYLAVGSYGLNTRSGVLADPRLRHAVVRALDPAALVARAYGPSAAVADGLAARGADGATAGACRALCDHDPAVARSVLAQSFPDGQVPPVFVDYDESPVQQALAEAVRDQLSAVGIPTFLRPHPFDEYDTFLAGGGADLFRLGWVGEYPSAYAFLSPLFAPGAGENVTGLDSPAVGAALAAAQAAGDASARARDLAAAERGVLESFAAVPVVQFVTTMAAGAQVRDLVVDGFGAFDPGRVWLAG